MAGYENGQRIIDIDVTDEHAFRTGVIQHLQYIADRTSVIPELKQKIDDHDEMIAGVPKLMEKVDKHDAAYKAAKWMTIPFLAFLSATIKHLFSKIGW